MGVKVYSSVSYMIQAVCLPRSLLTLRQGQPITPDGNVSLSPEKKHSLSIHTLSDVLVTDP